MKKNYFLIMLVLGFCSCKKEISNTVARPAEVDVYVAGVMSVNNSTVPGYWKNGKRILLDSAAYVGGYGTAVAYSLAVSGNDVYVAGYYTTGVTQTQFGIYWKNGMPVYLTDGSTGTEAANSIAVSGTDVYVAGYGNNGSAKYWKNGNPVNLTNGTNNAYANSIAVSGTDV